MISKHSVVFGLISWACAVLPLAACGEEAIALIDGIELVEAMEEQRETLQSLSQYGDADVAFETEDGELRIEHLSPGPLSIPLYAVEKPGVENCTLVYEAALRSKGLGAPAYLEMWCVFEGQKSRAYFSRALDDVLLGDVSRKVCRTPFFLKAGERPDRVLLGVRMEGPGTLWIDDLRLHRDELPQGILGAQAGFYWHWIPGTLLGVTLGIWGTFAFVLAFLGRGRRMVNTSAALLLGLSFVMAAAGIVLLCEQRPFAVWYAWLLPGLIGLFLSAALLLVARLMYRYAEARRMAAMDLSNALR